MPLQAFSEALKLSTIFLRNADVDRSAKRRSKAIRIHSCLMALHAFTLELILTARPPLTRNSVSKIVTVFGGISLTHRQASGPPTLLAQSMMTTCYNATNNLSFLARTHLQSFSRTGTKSLFVSMFKAWPRLSPFSAQCLHQLDS